MPGQSLAWGAEFGVDTPLPLCSPLLICRLLPPLPWLQVPSQDHPREGGIPWTSASGPPLPPGPPADSWHSRQPRALGRRWEFRGEPLRPAARHPEVHPVAPSVPELHPVPGTSPARSPGSGVGRKPRSGGVLDWSSGRKGPYSLPPTESQPVPECGNLCPLPTRPSSGQGGGRQEGASSQHPLHGWSRGSPCLLRGPGSPRGSGRSPTVGLRTRSWLLGG